MNFSLGYTGGGSESPSPTAVAGGLQGTSLVTVSARACQVVVSSATYAAVIFDLDGVITTTAKTHFESWSRTFNRFLRRRAEALRQPFQPFSYFDYRDYVDGKPRYDGAQCFLESRLISLPFGFPSDQPGDDTVCGLANRKAKHYLDCIRSGGVEVYPAAVDLLRKLRPAGVKTAVATSSKNRAEVLSAVGLSDLFDAAVDGNDLEELGIAGKPEPDMFELAAERLGVAPQQAVVVEDALSGVQAGRKGGFALVVGVNRSGSDEPLRSAGADVVVHDLSEIDVSPRAVEELSLAENSENGRS